ncbi:Uncharacterized protein MSYG_1268 [Malassezia sympodialis ATCC 42132]|uniref:Uncharacterized protein n=1 Tax=Malassezia sympodialis (strain ATCC 42132) TaxID=1230383 RepID=A0A1M8A3C3_MALS4|nr:Uncharacterized protein MSYG_1268 [Malassezia sympodialis ATCC 42132]
MPSATYTLSYLNVFWLLHVIAELPLGILAFLDPAAIPLAHPSGSTLLLIQLLGAMLLTSSICALLCFGLPDYMPGKRAVAIQLLLFHGIVSAVFMRLPDGVVTFQLPAKLLELLPWLGMYRMPIWIAAVHGCIAVLATGWWQATLPQVQAVAAHAKSA